MKPKLQESLCRPTSPAGAADASELLSGEEMRVCDSQGENQERRVFWKSLSVDRARGGGRFKGRSRG